MSSKHTYPFRRNLPVARFYYQGQDHSHPVRRTVLIVESTPKYIRGYELREGTEVRPFKNSPVKTFSRKQIAKISQCGFRLRRRTPKKSHEETTLQIASLNDLVLNGV